MVTTSAIAAMDGTPTPKRGDGFVPRRKREEIISRIERLRPRRGPGRPRKLEEGDLCWWPVNATTPDGQTVRIRQYGLAVGRIPSSPVKYGTEYAVIRTRRPSPMSFAYGEVLIVPSWKITKVRGQRFRTAARRFWANVRLGDRGCACNCCTHVAIAPGEIRPDGRFVWEDD